MTPSQSNMRIHCLNFSVFMSWLQYFPELNVSQMIIKDQHAFGTSIVQKQFSQECKAPSVSYTLHRNAQFFLCDILLLQIEINILQVFSLLHFPTSQRQLFGICLFYIVESRKTCSTENLVRAHGIRKYAMSLQQYIIMNLMSFTLKVSFRAMYSRMDQVKFVEVVFKTIEVT